MREIRLYGSEGGGAVRSPYPYQGGRVKHTLRVESLGSDRNACLLRLYLLRGHNNRELCERPEEMSNLQIPAKVGIQCGSTRSLDSRVRGNDGELIHWLFQSRIFQFRHPLKWSHAVLPDPHRHPALALGFSVAILHSRDRAFSDSEGIPATGIRTRTELPLP